MFTERQFYIDLCKMMNWPLTNWSIKVLFFWSGNEFPDADGDGSSELYEEAFNPLATTRVDPALHYQTRDIGYGPGNWNNVPVKMYATHADGVLATAQTLNLSFYKDIREGFMNQHFKDNAFDDTRGDFVSWVGSDAYGQRVIAYSNSLPDSDKTPLVEVVTPLFTEEQKKELFKLIEFFVSTTYPLYWEALWNKGFTNYQSPLRPWDGEQRDPEVVLKELRDSLNRVIN